jgi:hypothetical protein
MDTNTEPTPVPRAPRPAAETPAPSQAAAATPATPAVPAPRPRRDPLPIVLALAALVAVGGVSFAGGRMTAPQAAAVTGLPQGAGVPGGGRNPGGAGNGQGNALGNLGRALGSGVAIKGTVTAVAADRITLRLDSGQTVDIPIDAGTTYHRQASATGTDLTVGTPVLVQLGASATGGAGQGGPNASNAPNPSALPGGIGRFIGTARDITIVAQ